MIDPAYVHMRLLQAWLRRPPRLSATSEHGLTPRFSSGHAAKKPMPRVTRRLSVGNGHSYMSGPLSQTSRKTLKRLLPEQHHIYHAEFTGNARLERLNPPAKGNSLYTLSSIVTVILCSRKGCIHVGPMQRNMLPHRQPASR